MIYKEIAGQFLLYIIFIASLVVISFSLGRTPFLNKNRQRIVLIVSGTTFLFSLILRSYHNMSYSNNEFILLSIILFASFVFGWRRKSNRGSLLFQKRSPELSGLITVEENKSNNARVIKRDGKTLSGINLATLEPTSSLYWYPHLLEVCRPQPKRVLCIGGGACAYPIYAIHKNPKITMDVIEIDSVVIEAAKKYFLLPTNKRFRLIMADAYQWIRESKEKKYDLIFVDVGIILSSTKKFNNTKFLNDNALEAYNNLLTKNGTLMINIITSLQKKDRLLNIKKLILFDKTFRTHLTFAVNPSARMIDLQGILHLFSKQKISIPYLEKGLKSIPSNQLSYKKNNYKTMFNRNLLS